MSEHKETFINVNAYYDKETSVLEIQNNKGKQLALFYVTEED